MRGRTNASNGGIFLNATTDNFEVATGNTIVAGDFVEYHYDTEEKTISGSSFANECFLVDATSQLYITRLSGYVTLISYNDSVITIEDSYITAQSDELVKYNDTTYINLSGKVFTVDVINKTISLSNDIGMSFQHKVGNYLVSVTSSTSSSAITVTVKTYSCTDLSNITLIDTKTVQDQTNTSFVLGKSFNNGICFALTHTYNSGSTHNAYGYLHFAYIDLTNGSIVSTENVLIYNVSRSSGSVSGSISFFQSVIGNRYISIYCYYGYTGNITYQNRIYDSESRDLKNTFTADNTMSNMSNYYEQYGYYYWLNCSHGSSSGSLSLYKTDIQTGLSELCDTMTIEYNQYPVWVLNQRDFIVLRAVSPLIYYELICVISDHLVVGTLTDTVQEWSGGINPMGVAKQSGNAGDTIAVYIPQVNS